MVDDESLTMLEEKVTEGFEMVEAILAVHEEKLEQLEPLLRHLRRSEAKGA